MFQERAMKLLEEEKQTSKVRDEKLAWLKYKACEYLPDPQDERDLQTHLRIWTEAKEKTIVECIENCQVAEDICHNLYAALREAQSEHRHGEAKRIEAFIRTMRAMVKTKVDEVTHYFMEQIDHYIPKDTPGGKDARNIDRDKIHRKALTNDYRLGVFGNPNKISRHYKVRFDDAGIETDLPRQFIMSTSIIRALWQSYDDLSQDVYSPELAVGGVVIFDIFKFPQQPTGVGKWTIRSVFTTEEMLTKIPYPDPENQVQNDMHTIAYQIPEYVYLPDREKIKVGWWDFDAKRWKTGSDAIEKVELESDNKISFNCNRYCPLALL